MMTSENRFALFGIMLLRRAVAPEMLRSFGDRSARRRPAARFIVLDCGRVREREAAKDFTPDRIDRHFPRGTVPAPRIAVPGFSFRVAIAVFAGRDPSCATNRSPRASTPGGRLRAIPI
jgi:hypothetical protein